MPRHDTQHLDLDEIVSELLHQYRNKADRPKGHVCVKTLGYDPMLGYDQVVHADGSVEIFKTACDHTTATPLLVRLADLIEPGQRAIGGGAGGKAQKSPKGSPAPWAALPAELLDEIEHGVIELHDTARRVLGLPLEPKYRGTTQQQRARLALEHLPSDVLLLALTPSSSDHWLVAGLCPGRPKCTIRSPHTHPGSIETRVRSWHSRALLVTGHEQRRAKVGQVENPMHPDNTERYYRGPICPAPDAAPNACDVHESCELMRRDRLNRYMRARCPWCNSVSLEQDSDTGHVECVRPSCRDEQGHRHMWTVEELAHLGLVIVTESAA